MDFGRQFPLKISLGKVPTLVQIQLRVRCQMETESGMGADLPALDRFVASCDPLLGEDFQKLHESIERLSVAFSRAFSSAYDVVIDSPQSGRGFGFCFAKRDSAGSVGGSGTLRVRWNLAGVHWHQGTSFVGNYTIESRPEDEGEVNTALSQISPLHSDWLQTLIRTKRFLKIEFTDRVSGERTVWSS